MAWLNPIPNGFFCFRAPGHTSVACLHMTSIAGGYPFFDQNLCGNHHFEKPQEDWLVVSIPLKNMKINWDDYSQYMEK